MEAAALISESRRRAGITQTELATRLGTHQSVVARWETGKARPAFETVIRVIEASGLEMSITLSGSEPGETKTHRAADDLDSLLTEMRRLHTEQARLRWMKGR